MLTTTEIAILRRSWLAVAAHSEAAGQEFYATLFDTAPELRPLFRTSQRRQARKLMDTLATVVDTLDDFETLVPIVQRLGVQHSDYGATPDHYAAVGQVLIGTLRHFGGASFTAEAEATWVKAYGVISSTMISAQRQRPHRSS